MFVSSRYEYRVLINVLHIIYGHCPSCLCVPMIDIMSLLLNTWSMIIVVYVCVSQKYIPCPSCSTFYLCSWFFIVSSRDTFHVHNVRHFIFDRRSSLLCLPEIYHDPNVWHIIYDNRSLYLCLPVIRPCP